MDFSNIYIHKMLWSNKRYVYKYIRRNFAEKYWLQNIGYVQGAEFFYSVGGAWPYRTKGAFLEYVRPLKKKEKTIIMLGML